MQKYYKCKKEYTPREWDRLRRTDTARKAYYKIFNYYLAHPEITQKKIAVVFKCSEQKIGIAISFCLARKRTKPYYTSDEYYKGNVQRCKLQRGIQGNAS